jgi:hypothetical protein
MVRRIDKDGFAYHTPPYTWQEQEELIRRFNQPPVAMTRPAAPARTAKPAAPKPQRRRAAKRASIAKRHAGLKNPVGS